MPWKETCVKDERIKFIARFLEEEWTITGLCDAFGISRKTGYKYIERYHEYGWAGLDDRSRAPENHPNQTSKRIEDLIIECKKFHRTWGPKKLIPYLKRQRRSI